MEDKNPQGRSSIDRHSIAKKSSVAASTCKSCLNLKSQYRSGDYEGAVVAYLKAAEMGMEVGQSNAAWMLTRGYGAQGPAASALAQKLHQRAAGQVPPLPSVENHLLLWRATFAIK